MANGEGLSIDGDVDDDDRNNNGSRENNETKKWNIWLYSVLRST
jgi:hypothetical protein